MLRRGKDTPGGNRFDKTIDGQRGPTASVRCDVNMRKNQTTAENQMATRHGHLTYKITVPNSTARRIPPPFLPCGAPSIAGSQGAVRHG